MSLVFLFLVVGVVVSYVTPVHRKAREQFADGLRKKEIANEKISLSIPFVICIMFCMQITISAFVTTRTDSPNILFITDILLIPAGIALPTLIHITMAVVRHNLKINK